jgi:hypothetical protein
MTPDVMTLAKIASYVTVDDLVGLRPDKRWGRASLVTPRFDGVSVADWFEAFDAGERVELVREALRAGTPWQPLLRVNIPKRGRAGETRPVDMATVLDQARLYLLHDWLGAHAETALTRVAAAFRRGIRLDRVILNAQRRLADLPFAAVIDIRGFFDNLRWETVDGVLEALPANEDVRSLMQALTRVQVVDRRSGANVERSKGIPQGLSVSPVIANLALNEFDQQVANATSRKGCVLRRYCDDILVIGPTKDAVDEATKITRDRLAKLGLEIKPGMGATVDTRVEPIEWLGVTLFAKGICVSHRTTERKAQELQDMLDRGILSPMGTQDSLTSLEQYYRRILSGDSPQRVIRQIRDRLAMPSSPPHHQRKEDIALLRALVTGHHCRGLHTSGSTLGLPDGTGVNNAISRGDLCSSLRGIE